MRTLLFVTSMTLLGCSEPKQDIDPAYLEAILAMEKEACACTQVPRDQVDACMKKRKTQHPNTPGGGDIMRYLERVKPEDLKKLEDSEVARRTCLDVIAATSK